jgi:hypothetical protein
LRKRGLKYEIIEFDTYKYDAAAFQQRAKVKTRLLLLCSAGSHKKAICRLLELRARKETKSKSQVGSRSIQNGGQAAAGIQADNSLWAMRRKTSTFYDKGHCHDEEDERGDADRHRNFIEKESGPKMTSNLGLVHTDAGTSVTSLPTAATSEDRRRRKGSVDEVKASVEDAMRQIRKTERRSCVAPQYLHTKEICTRIRGGMCALGLEQEVGPV